MEHKTETVTLLDAKKLEDADLNAIVGGTGENDLPKHTKGDIVYIVVNQTPGNSMGFVKVITLKCQIVSEPYRNFMNFWSYDVLVLAQDACYEGYESLVGTTQTNITDGIIAGAANYMAENGIKF